jgi:glyoxylase-like metal-dependent hydrolase (beta-lactamase superfamily II)
MILRQFLHTSPAVAASYLLGCGGKGKCIVVDPAAEPQLYLDAAAGLGMKIEWVIDTHVHADHRSTGQTLAAEAGAAYALHESSGAQLPHRPLREGERLEVGNVVVEVMHLPGHTPEHLGLLITDRTRSAEPWCVLTGHTLMVGDMGRTELASSARDGALALFDSAQRLRRLEDHVLVLPGAFSGSVCGRGLSGNPVSSIGFERRNNRAFASTDRGGFVGLMLRDIPPPPPGAAATRAANLGVELVPA